MSCSNSYIISQCLSCSVQNEHLCCIIFVTDSRDRHEIYTCFYVYTGFIYMKRSIFILCICIVHLFATEYN
jgi:hypothetical protein